MDQDPKKGCIGWDPELRWKDDPQTDVAVLPPTPVEKKE